MYTSLVSPSQAKSSSKFFYQIVMSAILFARIFSLHHIIFAS